ncbi:MAG: class I SAM-dependent methyltransferase [Anaerolineae bacterium]
MTNDDVKTHAQQRFGDYAQAYVQSKTHASGHDLERLVELAQAQTEWVVLDVATGGGHTALRFAPLVRRVVACDLTPKMVYAAREFIKQKGGDNVTYAVGDAEQLPFVEGSFDLVTCRIAPHHFPDCFRFVQECARVLKVGGLLLVEDLTVPDDERAARYVDSFERLRDPSHYRMCAPYEWQGMFLDAGLVIEHSEVLTKPGKKLLDWARDQQSSEYVVERLQVMLAQAPEAVKVWWNPRAVGTADAIFDHHYAVVLGRKSS